jgi:hypothetical protein
MSKKIREIQKPQKGTNRKNVSIEKAVIYYIKKIICKKELKIEYSMKIETTTSLLATIPK